MLVQSETFLMSAVATVEHSPVSPGLTAGLVVMVVVVTAKVLIFYSFVVPTITVLFSITNLGFV